MGYLDQIHKFLTGETPEETEIRIDNYYKFKEGRPQIVMIQNPVPVFFDFSIVTESKKDIYTLEV